MFSSGLVGAVLSCLCIVERNPSSDLADVRASLSPSYDAGLVLGYAAGIVFLSLLTPLVTEIFHGAS